LEIENRHLASCCKEHHWKGHEPSICARWDERYYQFAIWRELMSCFRWRPELEWGHHDLAFFDNEADSIPEAIAEIRLWGSENGLAELPSMRTDMDKFKTRTMPGVMLILTAHLAKDAQGNFRYRFSVNRKRRRQMQIAAESLDASGLRRAEVMERLFTDVQVG
jgi:hypothetical protein